MIVFALAIFSPTGSVHAVTPAVPDGDANCNLEVDAVDALAILRFRAGLSPDPFCLPAAEVDCASEISSVDALKVLRYSAGLLGDTPVGRCPEPGTYDLTEVYGGGFDKVVHFAMVPGSADEGVLATQKEARLYRVSLSDAFPPVIFADLSDRVGGGTQLEGLLSFAFSPRFEQDRRIYVYYSRGIPEPSVLSRFPVVDGIVDTANETVILEIPQYSGYNMGGHIAFDETGDLYLSVGDAGGPTGKAQDSAQLNGKVLRLRVEGEDTYSIPSDNPFVGTDGRDEIFALGFRNPWRMSVDQRTGRIWLGDVGEATWEEVNEIKAGRNYGWDTVEGDQCWVVIDCDPSQFEPPRAIFQHEAEFTSVTGGFVYRRTASSELWGWYVYASFYSGDIWALNTNSNDPPILLDRFPGMLISSFAELPNGDVAMVNFDGRLFVLERMPGT